MKKISLLIVLFFNLSSLYSMEKSTGPTFSDYVFGAACVASVATLAKTLYDHHVEQKFHQDNLNALNLEILQIREKNRKGEELVKNLNKSLGDSELEVARLGDSQQDFIERLGSLENANMRRSIRPMETARATTVNSGCHNPSPTDEL